MTTDRHADGALSPELEATAAAAHDRLHAQAGPDPSAIDQAARRGRRRRQRRDHRRRALSAIADAEHDGELRARQELSGEVLRQVTRGAKHKYDADTEYEHAITHAGCSGSPTARSPPQPRCRTEPSARSSPAPPRARTATSQQTPVVDEPAATGELTQ